MSSSTEVNPHCSDSQSSGPLRTKPRTGQEMWEHFRLGALIGLTGFGIVVLGCFVSPIDTLDILTVSIWGICLPLGTGVAAAVFGDRGLAWMGSLMAFLG